MEQIEIDGEIYNVEDLPSTILELVNLHLIKNNVSGASTKMTYVILKRFGYEEAFINKILYLIKNCNGIIDDDVIERNPVLAEKLYEVQYCDIMAQDTKYLKDRVDYLTTTNYKLKKRRSRLYKKR